MVSFLELKQCQQTYLPELEEAALRVIRSGWFLQGEETAAFERELSDFLGGGQIVPCGNGLDALRLIFRGYLQMGRLNPGDEILLPSHTFIATALAVTDCGLVPRFVESDPESLNMNLQRTLESISERTRAIVVVHLYGRVCWSEHILEEARQRGLLIIEDNAQAFGAKFQGVRTGLLGDAAAFSFYPGKNLGALGDAGAVVTADAELSEVVRALGNYGSLTKYEHLYPGFNSRIDELQAAFLRVKLKYIDKENEYRRTLAERYCSGITHPEITLPTPPDDSKEHVWHLFPVLSVKRDQLQAYLKEHGVQTLVHYPTPIWQQPCYPQMHSFSFPVTERICREQLSLPISSVHTKEEIDQVIDWVNRFDG